ncbi:VOC family protein [Acinetobacter sp. CFCC 10889]
MPINLVVLKVQDIERTCQFYSQFGLSFQVEQHENGP